jgi:mono/diheme cytochrome c family protein
MVGKAGWVAIAAIGMQALSSGAASALPPDVCDPNRPLYGGQLYGDHCATCHGVDATGGWAPTGAAAPDLTKLAQQAKGKFPAAQVADVIRYGGAVPGHGAAKMPIWAEVLHKECGPTYSRRAVVELVKYIQGLQR